MLEKTKCYLKETLSKEQKCLLGLSGGPDSMALLTLLVEGGYSFVICHIDHGWRKESIDEERILRANALKKNIPFFSFRIDNLSKDDPNIEDKCRQKRLAYFKEVYEKQGCSYLLLGHQRDDQSETILKRFFESSSLFHMNGMQLHSSLFGMQVLRPLLFHEKKEILAFLQERKISYFIDATNTHSDYLRARMRKETLPFLEKSFGKGLKKSLLDFGKKMELLDRYLAEKVPEKGMEGPFGYHLEVEGLHEIELDYLIRKIMERKKMLFSREEIDRLIEMTLQKKYGKRVTRGDQEVVFDQQGLFFIDKKRVKTICITITSGQEESYSWKDIWRGKTSFTIPYAHFSMTFVSSSPLLKKRYSQAKIPIVLRECFPVALLESREEIVEILTGKNHRLTLMKEKNTIGPGS